MLLEPLRINLRSTQRAQFSDSYFCMIKITTDLVLLFTLFFFKHQSQAQDRVCADGQRAYLGQSI